MHDSKQNTESEERAHIIKKYINKQRFNSKRLGLKDHYQGLMVVKKIIVFIVDSSNLNDFLFSESLGLKTLTNIEKYTKTSLSFEINQIHKSYQDTLGKSNMYLIKIVGKSISQVQDAVQMFTQSKIVRMSKLLIKKYKQKQFWVLPKASHTNACNSYNPPGSTFSSHLDHGNETISLPDKTQTNKLIAKCKGDKISTIIIKNTTYKRKYLSFLDNIYNFNYREKLSIQKPYYLTKQKINLILIPNLKADVSFGSLYSKLLPLGKVKIIKKYLKGSYTGKSYFLILIFKIKRDAINSFHLLKTRFLKGDKIKAILRFI
mmetsp:Transcript_7153/g.9960  ORF Transcript_7153/g.9960 Transcript_7153/m.9960 type:complete len:318 (+) Transcript_7153:1750-2703(+)